MKAKRYMKPPSCRKPATVIVPYAGQALDGQRPHQDNQRAAHLIGESGPKELEGDQRNNQPMSAAHTPCHDERSHEGGLPARVAHDLLRLIARRMRLLMLNRVGCLFDYQLRPTIIQVRLRVPRRADIES
jgi:hypothetical protein